MASLLHVQGLRVRHPGGTLEQVRNSYSFAPIALGFGERIERLG
jgi:hypothetical protein